MNAPAGSSLRAALWALASAGLAILGLGAHPAWGAPRGSLLFGGEPVGPHAPVERDAWLPTGAPLVVPPRPNDVEPPGCSFRYPVCVHRHPGVTEASAAAALGALEQAYAALVDVLALPAPEPDSGRGGSDGLDFYLMPEVAGELTVAFDPPAPWGFDRASAWCAAAVPSPGELARTATLCVGEAIAARLSPSATPSLRRAYANHLWLTVGAPTGRDLARLDDAQAAPERATLGYEIAPGTGAATLLFAELEATRGRSEPGALATALLATAASDTPAGALDWDDEPDLLDVLRHTLDQRPGELARLFGHFAVERAFLGSRDDGTHWPRLTSVGDAGRVRFDWSLPLSSLPRRVAVARPLEPTGAVYVWVPLDQALLSNRLGFQAEWEPPVTFQWTLVRIGRDGRELSRLVAPYQERATTVVQELDDLASAAAVLVVGTNLGGVDLEHPHDPDLAPFEPSGCTVYLTPI